MESYSLREAFSSLYKALHEWHGRVRSLSLLSTSLSIPCWCFIFLVSFVVLSLFEPNIVSVRSRWDFVALFFPLSGTKGYCFLLEKCNQCSACRPGHCSTLCLGHWPTFHSNTLVNNGTAYVSEIYVTDRKRLELEISLTILGTWAAGQLYFLRSKCMILWVWRCDSFSSLTYFKTCTEWWFTWGCIEALLELTALGAL